MNETPDSYIERRPAGTFGITTDDAGLCGNCLKHLDSDCECSDEEREEGYTLQERQENYEADLGEARFKEQDLD